MDEGWRQWAEKQTRPLSKEAEVYAQRREQLIATVGGRVVVVCGDEILGDDPRESFATEEEALAAARARFGRKRLLIRRVPREDTSESPGILPAGY